ncbi:MAG: peptidase M23 [Bacteroidetes bacterium]|nr:MAG: peptidase M23 [Bacteroidota bacterium]MBL1143602.1 peptidase M23 [Bacteroidota bacterium]MCB0802205.1 peptidoglycan DD-metalloendopeptidase family protein [Flavobacteriales bacterium]NOG56404.1 peptidoglycan DD-metalloendopeptidase family protein [Bacteroidota bacterium]
MSKSFIRIYSLFVLLLLVLSSNLNAQSKTELEQRKKKLLNEINYTNKLLEETEKTKNTSLGQLRQINKKISSRENLIVAMEQEIQFYADSISKQEQKLDSLQKNLTKLKEEYAEMIRNAYKNKSSYNKMMFIFSSDNFNQAFKRLKYFQQYAQFRQAQAEEIDLIKTKLDQEIKLLEAIKLSKQGLLQAKLNERNVLAQEKDKKQEVFNSLKGKEKELKKDLKSKQDAAKKIDKAIAKIIEEEIRKAREAAKKAGNASTGFPMTPEALELSNNFAANKGKLPWPVGEGVITSQFGEHPHPTLKDVKVQNNGIDISTKKGNLGRSVFEGTVSKIIIIPGEGKAVLVRHGEYFTLYSYFQEVYVGAGDKIETKQDLGILITEKGEASSSMHLEIWKGMTKLNPETWIFRK